MQEKTPDWEIFEPEFYESYISLVGKQLPSMTCDDIEILLKQIDMTLSSLYNKRDELNQKIDLYEEDWNGYELEELESVNQKIEAYQAFQEKVGYIQLENCH